MTQAQTPSTRQLPYVVGVIGALVGAAFFYGITTSIAVAVILGAPIGLLAGIIAMRAIPRIIHRDDSTTKTAQLNGAAPAAPTIEEQVKPDFKMKIKS